jgi:hypothetical protein
MKLHETQTEQDFPEIFYGIVEILIAAVVVLIVLIILIILRILIILIIWEIKSIFHI